MKDIQWKDEQIAALQKELDRLDHQYSVLFDAYQEQAVVVDRLRDKLNTVYYAYGTAEELLENKIISKRQRSKKVSIIILFSSLFWYFFEPFYNLASSQTAK